MGPEERHVVFAAFKKTLNNITAASTSKSSNTPAPSASSPAKAIPAVIDDSQASVFGISGVMDSQEQEAQRDAIEAAGPGINNLVLRLVVVS